MFKWSHNSGWKEYILKRNVIIILLSTHTLTLIILLDETYVGPAILCGPICKVLDPHW